MLAKLTPDGISQRRFDQQFGIESEDKLENVAFLELGPSRSHN
jgi:hypothetical protein